jgi:hypothetical protein
MISPAKISALLLLLLLLAPCQSFALGQEQYVESLPSAGAFPIVQGGSTATIHVDTNDYAGVGRAANDLKSDIGRVSGLTPALASEEKDFGKNVIIIGTLGKSPVIDQLIAEKKFTALEIAGKWESFLIQVVPNPLPGVDRALVICGSDKRGTIYGIYDVSEEIGVSPWYFWEDVPATHHDELFVKAGKYVQGPPAVKYRGIFINDEAPDLTGWAKEKFGGYNHAFYTNVFELLLRMKANYLWPAMWDNCFNEDDPLNPKLADEYGIVMGTSHVEPMMRADKEWGRAGYQPGEWNFTTHSNDLKNFWRAGIERNKNYENIITVAMRGKTDSPMSKTANIALLEEIVASEREMIADVYHTNAASVPQLWALYKEVQEYYELGMRVPDDVTLLWCDDNWGNIRRLPSAADRQRAGGSGIYYHLDYVGSPRNYKWVETSPITKVWEQMNLAYQYGANQIWIANVGHLQHVAYSAEFFLSMAWNPARWPKEKLPEYTRLWAEREFGAEYAPQIADIMSTFTKYNGRRKPELLGPDTFSLVNYREEDDVVAGWKSLAAQAAQIHQALPEDRRNAFFELVLYPVKACANLNELYVAAAKNRLYAAQGRASTDDYAAQVKRLFHADAELSSYYNHILAGGRWDHMMDQTHIGYTRWQQPDANVMPRVTEISVPPKAEMGVAVEGSTNAWPGSNGEAVLPAFDKFNQPARYLDVFNKGRKAFQFSAMASAPWILVDQTNGMVEKQQRLAVTIDWNSAPAGSSDGLITIGDFGTNTVAVRVKCFNPSTPARDSVAGFVEADGYVSMEAEHFTDQTGTNDARWEVIGNLGNTLSGVSIFPVTAPSVNPPENSPCLAYKMFLFHSGTTGVEFILSPTLNFVAGRGLRFAASFDHQPPQIITAVPANFSVGGGDGNRDWEQTVKDNVRKVKVSFTLAEAGEHTLKFWMVDPGVVLQKIVVDLGGVKPSYLGPPESFHR